MCRIASLFFLQGPKETCQVTRMISTIKKIELPSNFFLQNKAPKDFQAFLIEKIREHPSWYATFKNYVAQLKRGDFYTCDSPRPGRSKALNTPRIIDQIHELILEYRRISCKSIAEKLNISRERVGYIIHEDLGMQNISSKWVTKCLNTDQIHQSCQSSEQILELFRCVPNYFLSRLVTMEENLILLL